ncbi:MAG TPA: phosphatase PAP2 family protein [Patescibacteria group bacterium]|nr:phosphatase PAP2 family protein [Patescibacteria group bacterium]
MPKYFELRKKIKIILDYLPVSFWLSLGVYIIVLVTYKYFNLPFEATKFYNFVFLLVTSVTIIFGISFFYYSIDNQEGYLTLQLVKKVVLTTFYFFWRMIPFFLFVMVYNLIHDVAHLVNGYELDFLLIRIDRMLLFGNSISLMLEKIITPWLTSLMATAYSLYFVFFILDPVLHYFAKDKKKFNLVLLSVVLTLYLGLIGYILVPCVGPILAQQDGFSKDLILVNGQNYMSRDNAIWGYINRRGYFHCFPSLHFGITLVWLYFAWKFWRRKKYLKYVYYLHLPVVSALWLSTLYLRWHYLIDWVGGFVVAVLGIWLAYVVDGWWNKRVDKL